MIDHDGKHEWVEAPPGTAIGEACVYCGERKKVSSAHDEQGNEIHGYCVGEMKALAFNRPALSDFDPYE